MKQKQAMSWVRFSSAPQEHGDSIERQSRSALNWCKHNNVELIDTTIARAKSAYKGKHRELLEELTNRMKPGQLLLIEDMSRFSRQDPLTALSSLKEITDKGIEVVFLDHGGKSVTKDNFFEVSNILPNFVLSLLSNDEIRQRVKKLKSAWKRRKEQAKNGETARFLVPCWLRWNDDKEEYELRPERAKVVKRIFDLYNQGYGTYQITQTLNKEKVPNIGGRGKTTWNGGFVRLVLRSKVACGYYVDHQNEIEKPNYFPAVVTEAEWYKAQGKLKLNKGSGGRKEKLLNLFTSIAKCHKCNGTLYIRVCPNKQKVNYHYLACSNIHNGSCDCKNGIRYDLMEFAVFEVMTRKKMEPNQPKNESVMELEGKLETVNSKINKLVQALEETEDMADIVKRLKERKEERNTIQDQLEDAKAEGAEQPSEAFDEFYNIVSDMVYGDPIPTGTRLQCRELIRTVIKDIVVNTADHSFTINWKTNLTPTKVVLIDRYTFSIDGEETKRR